jgi:amino acid adenylation domain-containing protein
MVDAEAGVLLTQARLAPLLPTVAPAVLLIDDCAADPVLRGGGETGDETPIVDATPESAAYVMYTSGSTGRPKGVLVRHRNVVSHIHAVVEDPGLDDHDVVLAVTTYSFDISVADIFTPLSVGARVVIATSDEAMDVRRLSRLIEASGATYMGVTPVTWQALVEAGWGGSATLVALSGGDTLTEPLARALLPRVAQLRNNYGPTETTIAATSARVRAGEPVTLGRPMANARVYVLDSHGSLVPVGVAGEICIAGAGVTAGYLNRPDETERRFRPDPFHPGETMYRSGDRGRYLPDGRIEYLGRADDQLKIRGFRIEPGEVEAALVACEGVSAAVVRADGVGTERSLVAYVVPRGSSPLSSAALRAELRRSLPDYMVPSTIVSLPALPTTTSGKVDRRALPDPEAEPAVQTVADPPASALEHDLARIWARVLGLEQVDVQASFFDLGGHSLLAVRALLEVERELGVEVPLTALFRSGASVRGMAGVIAATKDPEGAPPDRRTPLFFVHPQPATVPSMRHFTGPLGADRPIEVLLPERPTGRFDLSLSIEEMTRPLVESVRAVQPSGPYLIAGYSLGGVLAYELATQLIAEGERVAWLGLLDTPFSGVLGRRPSRAQLFMLYAGRGWRVLVRQCTSALRRELRSLRVRLRPDPDVFDYRGAGILGSRYAPEGVDAHLSVFATDAMMTGQRFGPSLGWEAVHKGPLEKHAVPGDHESALQPPNVQVVAEVLAASLSAAAEQLDPVTSGL